MILYYIPKRLLTLDLCKLAVQKNGDALCYIPKEYITYEICEIAVKNKKNALNDVPEEYKMNMIEKNVFQINKEYYTSCFLEIQQLFPKKDISLNIK